MSGGRLPGLRPAFSHPAVIAFMSERDGGVSVAPYDSLNLRPEVGDDPQAVAENRARLERELGCPSVRLDQVHGAQVHAVNPRDLDRADPQGAALPRADAAWCDRPGLACEVQVADCLPVLFADRQGRAVAAAHAGWRGLAGGVLEATLAALAAGPGVAAEEVEVWLGPCIGPQAFEVGEDVLQAFGARAAAPGPRFVARADAPGKWWADLAGLARDRLQAAGVAALTGNDGAPAWCTVGNPSRFFSYRRDRVTGRMAAFIALRGAG